MKHLVDGDRSVHCEGPDGADYTLCGEALEAWDDHVAMESTHAEITCDRCIGIIQFCKKVRDGEIAARFLRRQR